MSQGEAEGGFHNSAISGVPRFVYAPNILLYKESCVCDILVSFQGAQLVMSVSLKYPIS